MLPLRLDHPTDRPFHLLLLAAHPDDIEIGAGATIDHLLASAPGPVRIRWVTLTGSPVRVEEARASAAALVRDRAELDEVQETFRESFLPWQAAEVKDALVRTREGFDPDLIIGPRRDDLHQDHALLGTLIHQVWRDHLTIAYEIAKVDGDLATPNLYVRLDREQVEAKIDHLHRYFPSQVDHAWFDPVAFRGLMRLRGIEAGAPSGYAEGFHARRIVL
jgi:LmbE family N-acetylglucosaminyl deacetylase